MLCYAFMTDLLTEVVLSLLFSKFQFAMTDKEIVWELNAIAAPTTKEKPGEPMMPLKLTPLQTAFSA